MCYFGMLQYLLYEHFAFTFDYCVFNTSRAVNCTEAASAAASAKFKKEKKKKRKEKTDPPPAA